MENNSDIVHKSGRKIAPDYNNSAISRDDSNFPNLEYKTAR